MPCSWIVWYIDTYYLNGIILCMYWMIPRHVGLNWVFFFFGVKICALTWVQLVVGLVSNTKVWGYLVEPNKITCPWVIYLFLSLSLTLSPRNLDHTWHFSFIFVGFFSISWIKYYACMTILLFLFLLYNNKNLVPKIWGWLWILNKLVSIGHMYSSFPYSILSKVVFSVTSLIFIYIYIFIIIINPRNLNAKKKY